MTDIFKPNLAGTPRSDDDIPFPVLASPKIDGVRAMRHDLVMSRSMKPIPNKFVQQILGMESLRGLDGELTVGPATHPNCMQNTTSGVMAIDKTPLFQFHVFDRFDRPDMPYHDRLALASHQVAAVQAEWKASPLREYWINTVVEARLDGYPWGPLVSNCPIVLVPHERIENLEQLAAYEAKRLTEGWEGVMVRSLQGLYKWGRSTPKEGGLLKIKRFVDDEAEIIGFVEEMENTNEKTTNELGRSKRSSHKAGKVAKGTLGAFVLRNSSGVEFQCGSGINDTLAATVWANQDRYMGQLVTYKSFPIGVKDAPRHPVFKAFRHPLDISK